MQAFIDKFWAWYERYYAINVAVTAALFSLQLVHLYWLTTAVVIPRLGGANWFFTENSVFQTLLLLVDYTEIPALITTSLLYIHEIKQGRKFKGFLYLIFLNVQWIHILWITDEVVVEIFQGGSIGQDWHPVAAWTAILIDYLELPVIYETFREFFRSRFASKPSLVD